MRKFKQCEALLNFCWYIKASVSNMSHLQLRAIKTSGYGLAVYITSKTHNEEQQPTMNLLGVLVRKCDGNYFYPLGLLNSLAFLHHSVLEARRCFEVCIPNLGLFVEDIVMGK